MSVDAVPQGYVMTVTVGALVLYGIRFTSPELAVEVDTGFGFPALWPATADVTWPAGTEVDGRNYMTLANARSLSARQNGVEVGPWTPAVDLPQSEHVGNLVKLPVMCGKHHVFYPASLVAEAQRGRFYYFATVCECPHAYLLETHDRGVRCIDADDSDVIDERYESLPGDEWTIDSAFWVKSVTAAGPGTPLR
ncbi:hypothetical protein [Microbacterium sp. PMB16]|uniref:hypothetical protein n=1 Tax=Microbacterium sp. PMB16 TaxID=3120157 RepID=UPI003F4CAE36